jgi:hypothetical protein
MRRVTVIVTCLAVSITLGRMARADHCPPGLLWWVDLRQKHGGDPRMELGFGAALLRGCAHLRYCCDGATIVSIATRRTRIPVER